MRRGFGIDRLCVAVSMMFGLCAAHGSSLAAVAKQPAPRPPLPLPISTAAQRFLIPGYQKSSYFCPPNAQNIETCTTTIQYCAFRCNADIRCVGFVYDKKTATCSKRYSSCIAMASSRATKVNYVGFGCTHYGSAFCDHGGMFYVRHQRPQPVTIAEEKCDIGNEGREFAIAFMSNENERINMEQIRKPDLEIWVTNPNDAQVTLRFSLSQTFSHMFSSGLPQTDSLLPKQTKKYLINPSFEMTDNSHLGRMTAWTVEDKVLRLQASDKIALYGINKEAYTTDAFLALPKNAGGVEYFAICHYPANFACEFLVASSSGERARLRVTLPRRRQHIYEADVSPSRPEEDCTVDINGRTVTNGGTFEVVLNEFQAFQLQGKQSCDLTGARIESISVDGGRTPAKTIAVWSGNLRTNIGEGTITRDHEVEQLPPVDNWGSSCAAWYTPERPVGDFWTVTAAEDNTFIEILQESDDQQLRNYGGIFMPERSRFGQPIKRRLLNRGETYRWKTPPRTTQLIRSNSGQKILVIQWIHSQESRHPNDKSDPSMIVCTPPEQFGYGFTFAFVSPKGVASQYKNFFTIIYNGSTPADGAGFKFDDRSIDRPIAGLWKRMPGTNDLFWGSFELAPETRFHTLSHSNPFIRYSAFVYGGGDRESYGYSTGQCIKREPRCRWHVGLIGDRIDNDCDGRVDEERCNDGIDNDGDGFIDEDCACRIEHVGNRLLSRFGPHSHYPSLRAHSHAIVKTKYACAAPY